MSTSNPTGLRVGMSGSLSGRNYSILGRIVMSMQEAGETWYWNEFFLKSSDGTEATLVFEDTENGPVWRFFEYFEPARPFSVVEASRIRPGTTIELDGLRGVVDRVDSSSVYHVEGQPPEGVQVGDLSTYFNATMNDSMLVVSWSGGEVEHFWGQDIARTQVLNAFGAAELCNRPAASASLSYESANRTSSRDWFGGLKYVFLGLIGLVWLFTQLPSCSFKGGSSGSVTKVRPLPEKVFTPGATHQDQGLNYTVKAEYLVEYATPSLIRHGRLYQLENDQGESLLLLQGTEPDPTTWRLVRVQVYATPPAPASLAALRPRGTLTLDSQTLKVEELFRLRIYSSNTAGGTRPVLMQTRYGLIASSSDSEKWYFDWDEKQTTCGRLSFEKIQSPPLISGGG